MTDTITLTGTVGTPPEYTITKDGLPITKFRFVSNHRRFDKALDKWIESDANWYSVSAFRYLATNTFASVRKGDRIVLSGKLRVRPWKKGERSGINIEIDAESLGHDLNWGTASFMRFASAGAAAASGTDGPVGQRPASGERAEERWATPGADAWPTGHDPGGAGPDPQSLADPDALPDTEARVEAEADAEVSAPF